MAGSWDVTGMTTNRGEKAPENGRTDEPGSDPSDAALSLQTATPDPVVLIPGGPVNCPGCDRLLTRYVYCVDVEPGPNFEYPPSWWAHCTACQVFYPVTVEEAGASND